MRKKTFSKIGKLTAVALMFTTFTSPMNPYNVKAADSAPDSIVKLRFLETTDLHDNVMDYDYYKDAPTIEYGLDRTAQLIKQARADVIKDDPTGQTYEQNSMLFDAGDLLQGNPMADYVARVKGLGPTEVHPMFKAMDLLHYDAGIVGNHEFNYGLDFLKNTLEEAPYSIVNSNIYKDDHDSDPTNDVNYFTPYKIIPKIVKDENGIDQTINVGVIGFAPPQIMQWDKDNLTGNVVTKDIVESANKFIPEMKAAGADIIVAIAHSGCDIAADGQKDAENAVYSLSKVPGIDALLFGHSHVNFPGDNSFNGKNGIDNVNGHINNVPAMEAGFWGNNLGVMDLDLQKVNGQWEVTSSNAALKPLTVKGPDGKTLVSTITGPDQSIVDAVKDYHEGTLQYIRGKIGTTSAPLYSYFAQVQDDPTIQIVNNAQTAYVKKWITDKNPELKDITVLSAGAPFKAGGRSGPSYYTDIPAGDLSIKSANDLYLYPNTLKAVELTGAQVREWLEMSAGQFFQVDPAKAEKQNIIDSSFPSYNFDVIDGVKYQIDLTVPKRYNNDGVVINPNSHRIVNLTMPDGTPVTDDQLFIVATNNYRAGGGGNFPGLKGGVANVVVSSPDESRQVLMNYIIQQGTINPAADNNWSFAPAGGVAKLTFQSSPAAKVYADKTQNIIDDGLATDGSGFEQYILDQNVHVQLLGINDYHGQLDYSTTDKATGKKMGGIQYLAGYLKEKEAANPNTLMVEAGDLIGASLPVSALLQDEPTIRFMNEIGFDVGTVGNHEFDEGVTELKRMINGGSNPKTEKYEAEYGPFPGMNFPIVAANVVDSTGKLLFDPYVVKEVGGVKIGFIGVVTTETPTIVTPSGVEGLQFTDETEAINKYAKELEDQGVKAIVVLAHDSGTSAADGSNPTGKAVDIANAIDPEVDVIFAAHDHKYMNSTVNGKLLVQSYSSGTAFSDVDVAIDPITQDIVSKKAQIISTFQDEQHRDQAIETELNGYKADIAPITEQVVGKAAAPILKTPSTAGETALGNLIADGMLAKTHTDFAFMNVGGIRNEIKAAGDIKWGDLFAIQPFGNDIVSENITGDQVRTLLNQQWAGSYPKIMQIAGLKYTWSDKLPVGQKVLDIYLPDGSKINPETVYSVTVNNFMADGGDGFTILKQGTNRTTWSSDLDAFVEYVKSYNGKQISAQTEGRILLDGVSPAVPEVNDVTDQTTKVTGKTVAGLKVNVKANGAVIGSSTAAEDGTFTVDVPVQKAGTKLTIIVTDADLNANQTTLKVTDVTDPETPVLDTVTNKDMQITGHAEAGTHIVITDGKALKFNLVADELGNFKAMLLKPLTEGTTLYVFSIDAVFHVSQLGMTVVQDVIVPNAPTVNQVDDNDKKVTGKAEAGSKVTVKAGKTVLGAGIADKNGSYSVTLKAAQKAGTVLSVTATDKGGNVSMSTTVTVVDKSAPVKPVVNEVKDSDKKITGKAEVGSKVTVKTGKIVLGTGVTDKYGSFSVTLKAAQKAGTVLSVTATDKVGNVSSSMTVTVVDKTAPSAPKVDKVKASSTKITGKAEAGSTIVIKIKGKVIKTSTVNKSGKFSIKISKHKAGTVLYVTAKDKAGNVSKTTKVTVKKK